MAFPDLQAFIRQLETRGELIRVHTPVDPHLEITEIADRLVKRAGPAVLFESVKGSPFPVAIGLMGTRERMALALGLSSLDDLATRVRDLMNVKVGGGLVGLLSNAPKLQHLAHLPPRRVRRAPVQEVVWRGDEADLTKLPVLTCWPLDGGPFVTLPLVITRDPVSGEYNMGMYRMQVMGKHETGMHWQRHKTGARHLEHARQKGEKLQVAVAIGGDPSLIYAATAPLPPVPGLNEYALAGFLRGQRYPVTRGVTVDLDVPANAEFIIEGYVDPEEAWQPEGPFGDHTGFYTLQDLYPRLHVTAITMRRDPVYPATIVGRPPMEDAYLIEASERLFLPAAQLILPEIVDYHMPPAGVAHNLVVVSIRKHFPGHAYKVANGLLGLGQMMFAKVVIVVDEDVTVTDFARVWEEVARKAVPGRDTLHSRGPLDVLDHSSSAWSYGGKLIIDATSKTPEERGVGVTSRDTALDVDRTDAPSSTGAPTEALPVSLPPLPGGALDQFLFPGGYWVVKVRKTEKGEGERVGAACALHAEAIGVTHVLLVDELTDVRDLTDVWWTVLNNIDAERDVRVLHGRLVWDGTRKLPEEGFTRDWPEKIVMDPAVRAKVEARWHVYGLPGEP